MISCELCHANIISGVGRLVEIGPAEHVHQIFICDDCIALVKRCNEVVIENGHVVAETIRHSSITSR